MLAERFSMSEILRTPVESRSDLTFISRLFDTANDTVPCRPCDTVPYTPFEKGEYLVVTVSPYAS